MFNCQVAIGLRKTDRRLLSHLPVLVQRDGAVTVGVVHVKQDCGEEEDKAQLAWHF